MNSQTATRHEISVLGGGRPPSHSAPPLVSIIPIPTCNVVLSVASFNDDGAYKGDSSIAPTLTAAGYTYGAKVALVRRITAKFGPNDERIDVRLMIPSLSFVCLGVVRFVFGV